MDTYRVPGRQVQLAGRFPLLAFTQAEEGALQRLQDSTSESAATADTTLDITETMTATIMMNNPPPKITNIMIVLL